MKLSILTVSWKDPMGLECTVNSLRPLLRASTDFEHVVVSEERPKTPSGWPLVWLEETHPQGIFSAMNRALATSSGEALWFLNGGDRLTDSASLQAALAPLWAFDGVWAGARVWEKERYCYTHRPRDFTTSVESGRFPCHQGFIYHRRAFREGPFPALKLAGDEAHFLRLWQRRHPVVSVPQILVDYEGTGRSQSARTERFEELREFYRQELPLSHPLQWHLARRSAKAWLGEKLRAFPLTQSLRPLWWSVLDRRGGYA